MRHIASGLQFALLAYCFMPNQLHLLVEGLREHSDLRQFVTEFKRRSGFQFRKTDRWLLWQAGYYERVLRSDEAARDVATYIIQNPVRAGLVEDPRRYPFLGSDVYALEDLLRARTTR